MPATCMCVSVQLYFIAALGTPITRVPIMAKQPLDLYKLYQHVVAKGGLLEVGTLVMGCHFHCMHYSTCIASGNQ